MRQAQSRRPPIWKNVLLFCAVFAAADAAAGAAYTHFFVWRPLNVKAARVYSPVYHHDLLKNASTRVNYGHYEYPFFTNVLGFRDFAPRAVDPRPSEKQVVLIGDSFVEGEGLPYEKTMAGRITRELEKDRVRVLNAGVASYSPAIYFRKTLYLLDEAKLRIDELVVFIDISDIWDESRRYFLDRDLRVRGKMDATSPFFEKDPWWKPKQIRKILTERSIFFRTLFAAFSRLSWRALPSCPGERVNRTICLSGGLWTVQEGYFRRYGQKGLENAARNMDKLAALAKQRRIPLTIAVYPWPTQVYYRDLESKQVVFWRDWAAKNGAGFIDYFPYFIGSGDAAETIRRYFIPDDMHWNEAGSRYAAEIFLKERRRRDGIQEWYNNSFAKGGFMPVPKEGTKAPEFTLPASNGKEVSLKDFKGKQRVVLYFYPKDDTPGCTVEACGFRDRIRAIEGSDAVVLGVSPDGADSHNKFVEKFKLPFLLLSDTDKKICQAYGVWVEKSMYGKTYMGVARTTFVIGKDGRIGKVFEKVKPEGHDNEVLEYLKATA